MSAPHSFPSWNPDLTAPPFSWFSHSPLAMVSPPSGTSGLGLGRGGQGSTVTLKGKGLSSQRDLRALLSHHPALQSLHHLGAKRGWSSGFSNGWTAGTYGVLPIKVPFFPFCFSFSLLPPFLNPCLSFLPLLFLLHATTKSGVHIKLPALS